MVYIKGQFLCRAESPGKNINLNGSEVKAYRVTCKILGKKRTAVVYFSGSFYEGVLNGVEEAIKKRFAARQSKSRIKRTFSLKGFHRHLGIYQSLMSIV